MTHQPGRDFDALIAERVMGLPIIGWDHAWVCEGEWVIEIGESGVKHPLYLRHCACDISPSEEWSRLAGHTFHCLGVVPRYSEDIRDAWQVVERMREHWEFGLDSLGYASDGERIIECLWRAWFWRKTPDDGTGPHHCEDGQSAAHAICLAALAASTPEGT